MLGARRIAVLSYRLDFYPTSRIFELYVMSKRNASSEVSDRLHPAIDTGFWGEIPDVEPGIGQDFVWRVAASIWYRDLFRFLITRVINLIAVVGQSWFWRIRSGA